MNPKDESSAILGALAVIKEAGELKGRIRLQKIAYILGRKGEPLFEALSFRYKHYGPFSDSLAQMMSEARSGSLLDEETEPWGGGPYEIGYKYKLTDSGRRVLDSMGVNLSDRSRRLLNRLLEENWRTLELTATAMFLSLSDRSPDFTSYLPRALAMKPKCEVVAEPAHNLLQEIAVA